MGDDLNKIGQLLDARLKASEQRLGDKLEASEQRFDARLNGVEERLTATFSHQLILVEGRLNSKISDSKEHQNHNLENFGSQLMADIGMFMEDHLFPMIEEKADKTDIDRLERKMDHISDKINGHDNRIKRIELTPTVAHELKH